MSARNIFRLDLSIVGALFAAMLAIPAHGQARMDPRPQATVLPAFSPDYGNANGRAFGGYIVGKGDILDIRVAEEDDLTGRYQVDGAGEIQLPLLSKPIHAAGLSTFDLSKKLSEALKQQDILREPAVTVFIERGMSQNITIMGPVARPGVYPIEKPTRLTEALSLGGGLLPTAGSTVVITHHQDDSNVSTSDTNNTTAKPADVTTVDLAEVMSGKNISADVLVQPGDVITVEGAAVVYVVGAVVHPGAFSVQDQKSGLSVMRAVALVEGTQSTAALGRAIIVRQSTSESERQEIPVDVGKVMKGKAKDPILLANDILFIPQSGLKQTMHKMGDVATQAASEMTGYGLALRIAQ